MYTYQYIVGSYHILKLIIHTPLNVFFLLRDLSDSLQYTSQDKTIEQKT